MEETCHHCGQSLEGLYKPPFRDESEHKLRFCCTGCAKAFDFIKSMQAGKYYTLRDQSFSPSLKGKRSKSFSHFDRIEGTVSWKKTDDKATEYTLLVKGVHCPACVWLIEKSLTMLGGVIHASMLFDSRTLIVRSDNTMPLSPIMERLWRMGYEAVPYQKDKKLAMERRAIESLQWSLGLSFIAMMQAVMLSIALHIGEGSMSEGFRSLLRGASVLLSFPALVAAYRIFLSSFQALSRAMFSTMDIPISLAILLGYGVSVWHVWQGQGAIYFESVTMFVFLVVAGRLWHKKYTSSIGTDRGMGFFPEVVFHKEKGWVKASSIEVGDSIAIKSGVRVSFDGVVGGTEAIRLDESVLSGESHPIVKQPGDSVRSGARTLDQGMDMKVTGKAAYLEHMIKTMQESMRLREMKPEWVDRLAFYWVAIVLVACGVASFWWWQVDADRAVDVALSMLVASCPCALSLASPTAFAVFLAKLRCKHLVVDRGGFLPYVHQVKHVVFDKTGTLTQNQTRIVHTESERAPYYLGVAGALEVYSCHPLASAFHAYSSRLEATGVRIIQGEGVTGEVEGVKYRLGSIDFVMPWLKDTPKVPKGEGTKVYLVNDKGDWCASFSIESALNKGAKRLVRFLQQRGVVVHLLTGDGEKEARKIAASVGIKKVAYRQSPEQKADYLKELKGKKMMVGDGLNDLLAFGVSDMAIAMGGDSEPAARYGDVRFVGDRLFALSRIWVYGKRLKRVLRQNLGFAAGYNVVALSVASLGVVDPVIAVFGMTLSSLLVTMNAIRWR